MDFSLRPLLIVALQCEPYKFRAAFRSTRNDLDLPLRRKDRRRDEIHLPFDLNHGNAIYQLRGGATLNLRRPRIGHYHLPSVLLGLSVAFIVAN